jgi:hypothetical protein
MLFSFSFSIAALSRTTIEISESSILLESMN